MEHMDRLYESPFAIPHEDIRALLSSEGFQLLRSCLANDAEYACPYPHIPSLHPCRDTSPLLSMRDS